MRTTSNAQRQLLLEVQKDGCRSMLYRLVSPSGQEMFIEESDLNDCSRPMSDDLGHPVHFSMKDGWTAITGFTSPEGMLRRQVWHQASAEWVGLVPTFIHADLRPLVQRSLAQVTRDAALNRSVTESIGLWLRALSPDDAFVASDLFSTTKTYRHAS